MSPKLKTLIAYLRENPPAQILCGLHHRHDLDDATAAELVDALECWLIVGHLRADDGDTVTIACDNPDFVGPGAIVECNGLWTGFLDRKFSGPNILEALRAAKTVRDIAQRETDAHGR